LFGCTFVMQVLTYLCATNLFIGRIVNGEGKGTPLDRFIHMSRDVLRRLDYGEMFLDSATGDIYSFDQAKGEFYPIANASIHHHKTAQENRIPHTAQTRVSMLKTIQYTPQYFDALDQVYVSNRNEMKCRVLKQHIQSWITHGLGVTSTQFKEFLVPSPGGWDVHPVNSADQENIYQVIAESHRGPMIITLKNIICTKFHVEPKYPETLFVLVNFVMHMSEKIYSEKQRDDVPLSRVRAPGFAKQTMNMGGSTRVAQSGHKHIPFNTATHCGFTFSKRAGPVLVMNNATTANTVKLSLSHDSESSIDTSVSFVQKKPSAFLPKKHTRAFSNPQPQSVPIPSPYEPAPQTKDVFWTRNDIREFLHPGYPIEGKPRTAGGTSRKITVKYVAFPVSSARSSISRSSSVPQISHNTEKTDRQERKASLDRKEKWVSSQDFRRVFASSRLKFASAPSSDPPTYPLLHQFREERKSAWVAGSFKK